MGQNRHDIKVYQIVTIKMSVLYTFLKDIKEGMVYTLNIYNI